MDAAVSAAAPLASAPRWPRAVRPLPEGAELTTQVVSRVAGWASARVRDEAGVDQLLVSEAMVRALLLLLLRACESRHIGRQ
jgi:hypothetical protein